MLRMSGSHNEQQQQQQTPMPPLPHFQYPHEHARMYHAPSLPSLAASTAAPLSNHLPMIRLPQLTAFTRGPVMAPVVSSRSPQSSSAGSSPSTSPSITTATTYSTNSSLKRPLRPDHVANAAVHPSAMLLTATASLSVSAPSAAIKREVQADNDDNDDDDDDVTSPPAHTTALASTRNKRRIVDADADDDVFVSGAYKAQRKPAPNATHELRSLRHDAARMEYQVDALRAHWRSALPDATVLLRACEAAKSKWITAQAEELNRQLKEQLLQQQLYLASLQHLVLQSPFLSVSRSKDLFDALHTKTELSAALSARERRETLQSVCDLGLRLAPAVVKRFVAPHAHRATASTPFTHASIMCDGAYTFASNVLACRIPHTTVSAVADAVRVYYTTLQQQVRTHVGLDSEFKFLETLSATSHYAQIRHRNGSELSTVVNTTFATVTNADMAVFVTDFVDHDAALPTHFDSRENDPNSGRSDAVFARDTCHALVLTQVAATDDDSSASQPHVLLQRVSVARYNLPPNSRLVHLDLKTTQQWLNGDLLLKVICQQLEAATQRRNDPRT